MDNYSKAESYHLQALKIRKKVLGEGHISYAHNLTNLGSLYVTMGNYDKAEPLLKKSLSIHDKMIANIFSISSERQRLGYIQKTRLDYELFLSATLSHFSDSPKHVREAFDLTSRRKGIVYEASVAQRDTLLSGRYPHLKPKLDEYNALKAQIAQKTVRGPNDKTETLKSHNSTLQQWTLQKEILEEELARQIPEINLEHKFQKVNAKMITENIPNDSVLVEFVNVSNYLESAKKLWIPHYIAFVVNNNLDHIKMINLGPAKPIDDLIHELRDSITAMNHDKDGKPISFDEQKYYSTGIHIANNLRKTIFDPILDSLKGKKRLILSPDGELTKIPFEVLPLDDDDNKKHLIDEYQISYLGTAKDLLSFNIDSDENTLTQSLILADPDFDMSEEKEHPHHTITSTTSQYRRSVDQSSTKTFERLEGTRDEGQKVSDILGANLWMDQDVLEGRLKAITSPNILHIASHAFFLPNQKIPEPQKEDIMMFDSMNDSISHLTNVENPLLRSGIALAGANTALKGGILIPEAEDGILTAEDVSLLDLRFTDMVVLSACDTGIGDVQSGEGVFGLRRAFMIAGAKTLVMSLWRISDDHTKEMMEVFYHNLSKGKTRLDSLHDAQLTMKEKHRHPFYWGAFILQGKYDNPLHLNQTSQN